MEQIEKPDPVELQGLKRKELIQINGGASPLVPIGFAIWLGNEIVQNWSDIKSGIKDAVRDGLNK